MQSYHKNLWICDSWTGTPEKFADLRLRNEPKNFADLLFPDKKKFAYTDIIVS
jgi:hypothetical protein